MFWTADLSINQLIPGSEGEGKGLGLLGQLMVRERIGMRALPVEFLLG